MLSVEVEMPACTGRQRRVPIISECSGLITLDCRKGQKENGLEGSRWMHPRHGVPITHYFELDSNTGTETPFFLQKAKLFEA